MPHLSANQTYRVRFTANGRPAEGEAEPRMLLSDFLRHVLGMTGLHRIECSRLVEIDDFGERRAVGERAESEQCDEEAHEVLHGSERIAMLPHPGPETATAAISRGP